MKKFILLLFVFLFFAGAGLRAQNIIYVNDDASGANNGASWANAYTGFQEGVNAAASGDRVFVAGGLYQPPGGGSFSMKEGVKIYGGFAGTENKLSQRNLAVTDNTSILKGNGSRVISNGQELELSSAALLDGFTITGGDASEGAGIYNWTDATFANLIITGNKGPGSGAGVRNFASSLFYNILITNNSAPLGAGFFNTIQNSNPTLINVTISGNHGNSGSEFYLEAGTIVIRNSIIYGNGTEFKSSGLDVQHSLVQGYFEYESGMPPYELASGNISGSTNPLFSDPGNGDFSLSLPSPAINAGSNQAYAGSIAPLGNQNDLMGGARLQQGVIDMGAFENTNRRILSPGSNNIVYVNQEVTQGAAGYTGDGSSWANAVPDLYGVLVWAREQANNWTEANSLKVWTARGMYLLRGGQSFGMIDHVKIYGGFSGEEDRLNQRSWMANSTTLVGNGNSVVSNPAGLTLSRSAVLDGFHLFGGKAPQGGGILNWGNATFANLTIQGNEATGSGGGICNFGSPLFYNVGIIGNIAPVGGGIFTGGNSSAPTILNVTSVANMGDTGAEFHLNAGAPIIRNSVFYGNGTSGLTGSAADIGFSFIQGWINSDNGNIPGYTYPFFTGEHAEVLFLSRPSPMINAGSNQAYIDIVGPLKGEVDLLGGPRLQHDVIDIGIIESPYLPIRPDANNILYINKEVNHMAPGYTGDGSSWENALPELADALVWAQVKWAKDGAGAGWDEQMPLKIYVATGTYLPGYVAAEMAINNGRQLPTTEQDNAFVMVPNTQLYGGFDPENGITELTHERIIPNTGAEAPIEGTILSGNLGEEAGNAYHVVISAGDVSSAALNGFIITEGNASDGNGGGSITIDGQTFYRARGAGMYNSASSPRVTNVMISGNTASSTGAGVANERAANAVFTNVTISGNAASGNGGGMFNVGSSPVLTNVIISGNTSGRSGGGIFNGVGTASAPTFPVLTNVTIAGNTAVNNSSGGVFNSDNANSKAVIRNSIVYGNNSGIANQDMSNVTHSLIQGYTNDDASGNIGGGTDPLFINVPAAGLNTVGDYQLQPNSPVINAGINDIIPAWDSTDAAGNSRIYDLTGGGTIDLGAYEYQGGSSVVVQPDARGILYVNIAAAPGGDGSSWDQALVSFETAIHAGDAINKSNPAPADSLRQIWVADGTYQPASGTSFFMLPKVKIYGSFAGTETSLSGRNLASGDTSILKGNGNSVIRNSNNGLDTTALLDGFKITGGNAAGPESNGYGGGIYNYSASPTFSRLTISANTARSATPGQASRGGGIYNNSSSPVLTHVVISKNQASYGGGVYNESSSSPVLTNVTISGNHGRGGGMYNNSSSPLLTNVIIRGNTSGTAGGMGNESSSPVLTNVIISENEASDGPGGGMSNESSSPLLTNVTISANTARYGGGIYNTDASSLVLTNSILWGNKATDDEGNEIQNRDGSTIMLQHSLYGNGPNDIDGDGITADNSITVDPLFADAAGSNYQLQAGSPAINAGDNNAVPEGITTDLRGNSRIYDADGGGIVDMGAYESQAAPGIPFITTWQIDTDNEHILIPVDSRVDGYNYTVDWGDGNTSTGQTGDATHTYATAGTYTVSITGNFPSIYFHSSSSDSANDQKIRTIEQWGTQVWKSMANAFSECVNLTTESDTDSPIFAPNITVYSMFFGCSSFNSDLNDWDMGNVRETAHMFAGASSFNGDISSWNTENVLRMESMFKDATAFNRNIGGWNVGKVTIMSNMFQSARTFNQDIGRWNVSSVTNMAGMFAFANAFNQDIGDWDMTSVTNMVGMFNSARSFNQDIGRWNVSAVTDLSQLFYGAAAFNQDIGGWNVSSVKDMSFMFANAPSFNQDIGRWTIANVENMIAMFDISGLSLENYDATLIGWAAQENLQPGLKLGVKGLRYCRGADARQRLMEENDWTIKGDIKYELCGLNISPGSGNILYVDIAKKNVEGHASTGDSWANALPELADALLWARLAWGEDGTGAGWDAEQALKIYVAKGTYLPLHPAAANGSGEITDRDDAFVLVPNVQLYGGFDPENNITDLSHQRIIPSLSEESRAGGSILSGDLDNSKDLSNADAYHVLISANDVGAARLDGFTVTGGNANGEYSVLVNWIDIERIHGGGMFNNSASPIVINCVFSGNSAEYSGGGMFNRQASPAITGVAFLGNSAANQGGGMGISTSSPIITNAVFSGNSANSLGGGMIISSSSSPIITNSTFSGNSSSYLGGGIYDDRSDATLRNSIVYGNSSGIEGDKGLIAIQSIVQDEYPGEGVFDEDPLFINAPDGDLRLQAGSPAINTGNDTVFEPGQTPDLSDISTDLDGNARVQETSVDMGAYEYQSEPDPVILPDANGILYVDISKKDAAGHTSTGDSWENALPELADALKWANEHKEDLLWDSDNPLQIWVADGTYRPLYRAGDGDQDQDKALVLVPNVQVFGGFAGDEEELNERDWVANATTLSGDLDNSENLTDGDAYHVLIAAGDVGAALIDGFTVTGGYANGSHKIHISINGQGIPGREGGGMYNSASNPTINNVAFSGNSAAAGGGMFNSTGSSPVISNSIFSGNSATQGGGMLNNDNSNPTIINSTFSGNLATYSGGIVNAASSPIITNSVIYGNSSGIEGNGTPIITYSLVQGLSGGNGNIDGTDPDLTPEAIFVSPVAPGLSIGGNYHLQAASPVINIGSNEAYEAVNGTDIVSDLDLGGNPRVYDYPGGIIDMGAYEFQDESVPAIESLSTVDLVNVNYGTALNTIENLPTEVTAALSNGTNASVLLDGNTDNWTLLEPEGGTYDGETAGTYVFAVPLLLPEPDDEPYFINPEELQAEVTVVVARGVPILTASWNSTGIVVGEGLSLTYGDMGILAFSSTNPDAEVTYYFEEDDPLVLNLDDLEAVAAQLTGTASFTLQQAETDNFEAAALTFTVTVAPLNITVKADDKQKVFGTADLELTYTAEPALIGDDTFTGTLAREEGEVVGGYAITQGTLSAGDNYAITFEAGTLRITTADYENIAFVDAGFTYDGTEHALVITGQLPKGASVTYQNNGRTDAGAQTVTAQIDGGDNYEDMELTAELTVNPLVISVAADDKGKVYGTGDPQLTYMADPFIGDDSFTGALAREAGEAVGEYTIMQGTLTAGDNYAITFETGDLTVSPATLTINAVDDLKPYDGVAYNGGNGVTVTGWQYDDTAVLITGLLSYGGSSQGAINTGQYEIIPSGFETLNNYVFNYQPGTLIITPGEEAVITFPPLNEDDLVYGDPGFTPGAGSSDERPVEYTSSDETVVIITPDGEIQIVGTGPVKITASLPDDPNYEDVPPVTQEFIIKPATLTITAVDDSKVYNGAGYNGGNGVVATGWKYDDTDALLGGMLSYSGSSQGAVNTGEYVLVPDGYSAANYEIVYESGTLRIGKAPLVVTAVNKTRKFGQENPEFTFNYQGFVSREKEDDLIVLPIAVTTATEASPTGVYAITASGAASENYQISYVSGTLTVIPATRLLVFDELPEKTYEDADFDPGAEAHPEETILYSSSDESVAEIVNGMVHIIGAGNAVITATLAENANYENTPSVSRELIVHKAPQTIDFVLPGEVEHDAGFIALQISTSSGLPVTLSSSDVQVAIVASGVGENQLEILRLGTSFITAMQPGNANYLPAEPVSRQLRVVDLAGNLIKVHQVVSPNSDGINEFLLVEGIRDYPENKMTIVTRSGAKVFEIQGYDNGSRVFTGLANTRVNYEFLPQGTYFYVLEFKTGGQWKRKTGWFVMKFSTN